MNLIIIFILFSFIKFKVTNLYMKQCLLVTSLATPTIASLALFQESEQSEENDVLEQDVSCSEKKTETKEDEYVKLRRFHNQCVLQTGVAPNLIKQLMHGNWNQKDVSLKKWTLCVMNKLNLMSPEGVIKMDVVWTRVAEKDKTTAEKIIDKCLRKLGSVTEPHEIAWSYLKCHHANDPQGDMSAIGVF